MMEAKNKKEINEQIDYIRTFLDETVHPVVSPSDWWVYSELCDLIDQLKITFNRMPN